MPGAWEKSGKDRRKISNVRRRPGHAFLWPDLSYKDPDCLSARSLWGYETFNDIETKGMATPDLCGTLFICSKIIYTLRNMTQYYGIIESVLLLPITWYLFHPGTSASLITWAGGPIPRVFHRDDRHSCSYTIAQLRAHEKAKTRT